MISTKISRKNFWSFLLLIFPTICLFSPIKKLIFLTALNNCKKCNIEPGFRFYFGKNIKAINVSFGNTLLMDYDSISIGKGSSFSKDCIVITAEHDLKNKFLIKTKPVVIGENVWIATRSIILPGVKIGNNCVIGAGSVVTHSMPANCLIAGNPAKIIKRI